MVKRSEKVIILVLIAMAACACAELPDRGGDVDSKLPKVDLGADLTVSGEWGNLVAVSNSTSFPDLFQLWFQDEAGNIHMVVYDDETRSMKSNSVLIQRH